MRFLARLLALLFAATTSLADFDSAADVYRAKDYVTAYREFSALAEQGDPRAQTVVALMHKYGEAVPQDLQAAFSWYMKAASAGYAPAQYNVGEMYADGVGVEPDREEAVKWLRKAAEAGFERANDKLAQLNAEPVLDGVHVDQSVPWSQTWNFRLPNDIRYEAPPADAVVPDHPYRVQLGAMATRAGANRLWEELTTRYPELFRDVNPIIRLVENTERRIYRVQTGPFEDLRAARAFCDKLKQRRGDTGCLPLRL